MARSTTRRFPVTHRTLRETVQLLTPSEQEVELARLALEAANDDLDTAPFWAKPAAEETRKAAAAQYRQIAALRHRMRTGQAA
jgi:hypothetical protein